jgi:hypothetical protein
VGYPYKEGNPRSLYSSDWRFPYLDTNRDGDFNALDDPYSAYYPGDDVVDWVSLSVFYRGPIGPNQGPLPMRSLNRTFLGNGTRPQIGINATLANSTSNETQPVFMPEPELNFLPPKDLKAVPESKRFPFSIPFEEQLTGGVTDLYKEYVVKRKKPLALWNIGAAYYMNGTGSKEFDMKKAWFDQVLSPSILLVRLLLVLNYTLKGGSKFAMSQKYPLIKAAVLFNKLVIKDPQAAFETVDYAATGNPFVLEMIRTNLQYMARNGTLIFSNSPAFETPLSLSQHKKSTNTSSFSTSARSQPTHKPPF